MAVYQGTKSELMKSQRVYLPNDIIFEFDDSLEYGAKIDNILKNLDDKKTK